MHTFVIIGMTGEGKSEFVKKYILGRACCVFDVQNEYGPRTKYPGQTPLNLSDNLQEARARMTVMDEKKFIEICAAKRNTVCVFEEATGFFEGKTEKDLRRLMLSKIHTGNVLLFIFHSISSVPPRIMQMTDFVVLHKTNDEEYQVKNKYPSIFDLYLQLKQMPKGAKLIKKLS